MHVRGMVGGIHVGHSAEKVRGMKSAIYRREVYPCFRLEGRLRALSSVDAWKEGERSKAQYNQVQAEVSRAVDVLDSGYKMNNR